MKHSISIKVLISTLFLTQFALASEPKSTNVLEFNDKGILFIADSTSSTIYGYETSMDSNKQAIGGYNLKGIDSKLAKHLQIKVRDLAIKDMALHPITKEAYFAISYVKKGQYHPAIVTVNQLGKIKNFDLKKTKHTEYLVSNTTKSKEKYWGKTPLSSLMFTDIDFHKGNLYVSGLSNAEFSSTLRVIPFPFVDKAMSEVSVEVFHANHNQMETRAPIRTLDIVELDGKEYLIAAYTCTPLVSIPLDQIKNGAHIVGKTIAELGYGNTPIDFISFTAQDWNKNNYDVLMLSNKNQSAQVIPLSAISQSNKEKGLDSFAGFQLAGTKATPVPMTGIMQLADQDNYHLLALRRNADNGEVELVSYMKNLYFRLSDFESEYDHPGYAYSSDGSQEMIKGIQNMMKKDEGFADEVVK
ncbi:MAG: hypothetical protein COA86_02400 [Kangiella sp.]|nr:MAG: hypothetical protein COA86_02400 [Kangiella sp.]